MELEILYRDKYLVAVNKPHGLLVHRTKIADDAKEFALQILREQLGQKVYPIHRIDRKTGGVLLFGLDETTHKRMQSAFANKTVQKKYIAIVRGYTDDEGVIDYPLANDKGKKQEAVTRYKTIDRTELPIALGKFSTSRYSLIELMPETGRFHQIRKHMDHIRHPIICDRPHGCNKQNKLFKEKFGLLTMLLHALELHFMHPITDKKVIITADLQDEFKRMIKVLGFDYDYSI